MYAKTVEIEDESSQECAQHGNNKSGEPADDTQLCTMSLCTSFNMSCTCRMTDENTLVYSFALPRSNSLYQNHKNTTIMK